MEVDVVILSDQHRPLTSLNTWISKADKHAAIWVRKGVPVLSHEKFIGLLNNIVDEARGKTPILVAGDFNAWATEWGSSKTKPRSRALLNALATLDVLLLNTGSKPTFVGDQGESVIDLTFAGVSLYNRVGSWQVSDIYTSIDHKVFVYEILLEENQGVGCAPAGNRRWSAQTFDVDSFAEIVSVLEIWSGSTEDMVHELVSTIACDASLSGGCYRWRREPVYWWNDDIVECRRD
uniref:Endonuclease/exonuclease/phosphatase domain-containing protein n=1 Tax=Trichogramma kaykai TaxID=54128 RepID=A0ABD2WHL1_9HYME